MRPQNRRVELNLDGRETVPRRQKAWAGAYTSTTT